MKRYMYLSIGLLGLGCLSNIVAASFNVTAETQKYASPRQSQDGKKAIEARAKAAGYKWDSSENKFVKMYENPFANLLDLEDQKNRINNQIASARSLVRDDEILSWLWQTEAYLNNKEGLQNQDWLNQVELDLKNLIMEHSVPSKSEQPQNLLEFDDVDNEEPNEEMEAPVWPSDAEDEQA